MRGEVSAGGLSTARAGSFESAAHAEGRSKGVVSWAMAGICDHPSAKPMPTSVVLHRARRQALPPDTIPRVPIAARVLVAPFMPVPLLAPAVSPETRTVVQS